MKKREFCLICKLCNYTRFFDVVSLADLSLQLKQAGYAMGEQICSKILAINSKTTGAVGICPVCRGHQYWADGMGCGFEDVLAHFN